MDYINSIVKANRPFADPKVLESATQILQYLHDFKHPDTNVKIIDTSLLICMCYLDGIVRISYSPMYGNEFFINIMPDNTFSTKLFEFSQINEMYSSEISNMKDLETRLMYMLIRYHSVISRFD